jgi:hypothetical protein
MKTKVIVGGFAAIAVIVAEVWLIAAPQAPALHQSTSSQAGQTIPAHPSATAASSITPAVGTPNATPSVITVNTPVTVTVTAQINPVPLAGGVNLLRLGATGTQPTVLGVMHDDGKNGDAAANDGVYTLQLPFNEHSTGQIQLQVSVAFSGSLKRVLSSTTTIPVWNSYNNTQLGASFQYPPQWTVNNTDDSNYFTNGDIEVLEVATSTPTTSLQQFAEADIASNNCPAVDANNNPVDHIIAANATGVLYVLSCSATTDDYNYIFLNLSGQLVKLTYHDNFDPTLPEAQQLATFQQLISTVSPH